MLINIFIYLFIPNLFSSIGRDYVEFFLFSSSASGSTDAGTDAISYIFYYHLMILIKGCKS